MLDVSIGAVTPDSALVWVGGPPELDIALSWHDGKTEQRISARLGNQRFAHVPLRELAPATHYQVTVSGRGMSAITASFITPPPLTVAAPVRFMFGGDLAGQNACRDAARGFPIFDVMAERDAAFFIGLGDMIYADNACEAVGSFGNAQIARVDMPLGDRQSFSHRWRYNHADAGFARLRRLMAYVPVWDDHEIINDFGPTTARAKDTPDVDLLAPGRAAFIANNPVPRMVDAPNRLYHRFHHGGHAEFFVLDTRQYRDDNRTDDVGVLPKSLLGATQRQWLIDALATSQATWKFVISSVPISIPTGYPPENGRDGWASGDGDDGFERELHAIFQALADHEVRNLVWLSTDVHFATGFAYRPLPKQPEFGLHEFIVGPLSAGIYPTQALDETFSPTRLFFHGPETVRNYDEALAGFNFGDVTIDALGALHFELVNALGESLHTLTLRPQ